VIRELSGATVSSSLQSFFKKKKALSCSSLELLAFSRGVGAFFRERFEAGKLF